jgi:hypothetical protein
MSMAKADQPAKAKGERARAVKRLHEVVIERRRLRAEPAGTESSEDISAPASVGTADKQVAAPRRRLKSVEKQDAKS